MDRIEIVEQILLLIRDPRTICRLACVSRTFLAASVSNVVWRRFLPDNYAALLSDAGVILPNGAVNLKDIWIHFTRQSLTLDGGNKKCWIDPTSGILSYLISSRNLDITWMHDNRYWTWLHNFPGAWFEDIAELNYVFWFNIEGNIQQIFAPGSYVVLFRMQVQNPPTWSENMIKLGLRVPPAFESEINVDFSLDFSTSIYPPPNNNVNDDQEEEWVECEVGRFQIGEEERNVPINIQVYMREIENMGFVKSDFRLDGVIIRSLDAIWISQDNEA